MKINIEKITKKGTAFLKRQLPAFQLKKLPNDSFEVINASKKANARVQSFKNPFGQLLSSFKINKILLAKSSIDVDEYKKLGGSFVKGKAFIGSKPFNGRMIKEANGKKYVITYEKGLLKEVNINPDEFGHGKIIKQYKYDTQGRILQVVVEELEPIVDINSFLSDLPKLARSLAPTNLLYKRKTLSKTIVGDDYVKRIMHNFSLTPEGIRRSKMSDDEIKEEITAIFKNALKKRGIDENLAPKLNVYSELSTSGGFYNPEKHTLNVNIEIYRKGALELENTIEHEVTHCEQSILRASIPKNKRDEIIKEYLFDRIGKSEAAEVVYGQDIFGSVQTVKTPKMSDKTIKEFKQFMIDNFSYDNASMEGLRRLFGENLNDDQEVLLNKIKKLVKDNPDFLKQYESEKEAVNALIKYSLSHLVRFQAISSSVSKNLNVPLFDDLNSQQAQKAIESLIGFVETIEGNARLSKGIAESLFGVSQDAYNNYQFSQEEVLAQIQGNSALIASLKQKMQNMQEKGTLSEVQQINIENMIKKAQMTIEYKTKGMEWYRKTNALLHNPDNVELKEQVDKLRSELDVLEEKIKTQEYVVGIAHGIKHRC